MTVDFGYDLHGISIAEAVFAKNQAGHPVTLQGQGFAVEGVMEQHEWAFNQGAVRVITDRGRDVFEGNLWDTEVTVHRD